MLAIIVKLAALVIVPLAWWVGHAHGVHAEHERVHAKLSPACDAEMMAGEHEHHLSASKQGIFCEIACPQPNSADNPHACAKAIEESTKAETEPEELSEITLPQQPEP